MDYSVTDSKSEIISSLFSIRAGLSYIGLLATDIRAKQNKIEEIQSEVEEKKKKLQENLTEINVQENLEDDLRGRLEQAKASAPELVMYLRAARRKSIWSNTENKGKIFASLFLCLPLSLLIIWFSMKAAFRLADIFLLCALLVLVMFGGVIAFLYFSGFIIIQISKGKKTRNYNVLEAKRSIQQNKELIAQLEKQIVAARTSAPETIERLKKENQYLKNAIANRETEIARIKGEVRVLLKKCRGIYQALVEAYGQFLHPANWKHLDRVVYYVSTGRADNIRDALNLMDQRLNAELIANEIRASAAMISGEIRQATKNMITAMESCADMLNQAICSVGAAIADRMDAQIAVSEEILTAQMLNNALQARSNATMDDILSECRSVTG